MDFMSRWTPCSNVWRTCWPASPSTGTFSTPATPSLAKGPGYCRWGGQCAGSRLGSTLQDGTFSFEDFAKTFDEYDVQRVIRSYENSISIHVHCCEEGEWTQVIREFYGMKIDINIAWMQRSWEKAMINSLLELFSGQDTTEIICKTLQSPNQPERCGGRIKTRHKLCFLSLTLPPATVNPGETSPLWCGWKHPVQSSYIVCLPRRAGWLCFVRN